MGRGIVGLAFWSYPADGDGVAILGKVMRKRFRCIIVFT
jgi:hypothetical protein